MKLLLTTALLSGVLMMPALANTAEDMNRKVDYHFSQIDDNRDGRISQDEHETFAEEMFEDADKDNNDELTRQEVLEQKQAEKAEMKASMGMRDDGRATGASSGNRTGAMNDNVNTPARTQLNEDANNPGSIQNDR